MPSICGDKSICAAPLLSRQPFRERSDGFTKYEAAGNLIARNTMDCSAANYMTKVMPPAARMAAA